MLVSNKALSCILHVFLPTCPSFSNDLVLDPFGGSCVTGEVAERLRRKWLCAELIEDYLQGAVGRFEKDFASQEELFDGVRSEETWYKIPRPGILWNGSTKENLAENGGKQRTLVEVVE
jgi:hypothetical protein